MDWLYTCLMVLAAFVCATLLRRTQNELELKRFQKIGIGVGAFVGALIGAKLPFALYDWEGLKSGAVWFAHGKTILAGLVGGYLGVEYAKWCLGIKLKTGDTFAIPVAIGVAIGRIGCFFGGCCYGEITTLPWGCVFPSSGQPTVLRHPTQLYESLFHFCMAAIMYGIWRAGYLRGQLMKFYILAYLAYRFLTEYIRPEEDFLFGLTAYQISTLALVPIFVGLWIADHSKLRANARREKLESGVE